MSGRAERGIVERIWIDGRLELLTPAHFGGSDTAGLSDVSLLRDSLDGSTPLLPGASLAGALRTYLREMLHGYRQKGKPGDPAGRLFGELEDRTTVQSWLLVDDAFGSSPGVELRDGVALDPKTRTARDKKKYDMELLEAGTTFDLSMELLLNGEDDELLPALASALRGLQQGEIGLGLRKRRGLGRCRVTAWRVCRFRLTTAEGLIAWLEGDRSGEQVGDDIVALLGVTPSFEERREIFALKAEFEVASSLLIRSAGEGPDAPDMIHLHSRRQGQPQPILPGTSLAGALRGRALRIASTLHGEEAGKDLVDGMFGRQIEGRDDEPSGSRVIVEESLLSGTRDLVQNRVKIDRFTGGSYPGALFGQQPVFGGAGSHLKIDISLRNPMDAEIGLLLLVLKDLWTGDLPLGGESGVGRGRLGGKKATLTLHRSGEMTEWVLTEAEGGLQVTGNGTAQGLEKYVKTLGGYRRSS